MVFLEGMVWLIGNSVSINPSLCNFLITFLNCPEMYFCSKVSDISLEVSIFSFKASNTR